MDPKTKTFDAVEMSRQLREATSRLLGSLTREERQEAFRQARARYETEYVAYREKQKARTTVTP